MVNREQRDGSFTKRKEAQRWKGVRGEKQGIKKKLCHVCGSTPWDECNHYLLHRYTNKIKMNNKNLKFKINDSAGCVSMELYLYPHINIHSCTHIHIILYIHEFTLAYINVPTHT